MRPPLPLEILHLDLAEGIDPLVGRKTDGRDLYVVFWWRRVPVGHGIFVPAQLGAGATVAQLVAHRIVGAVGNRVTSGFAGEAPGRRDDAAPPLAEILAADRPLARLDEALAAEQPAPDGPSVSVVVCTRDRPDDLARCLDALTASTVRPDEVVVVDNAPAAGVTRAVVQARPGLTYVPEPRPGLSAARNAGIRAARGEIVAFTDDDAVVHPDWLWRLRDAFTDEDILSTTGLVLPAELRTESQIVFELLLGGFYRGYQRIAYDRAFYEENRGRGVPVWKIGAGANMAIRRSAFDLVGDFDERLGAGAAGCSEDSEFWYRILVAGKRCAYEPAAVVHHHHRGDMDGLRRQMHAYLRGHTAALFVQYARHGDRGNLSRAFRAIPRYYARRALGEHVLRSPPRSGTLAAEVGGWVRGLAYLPLARRDGDRA